MNDILSALPADCKSSQAYLTVPGIGRALKHRESKHWVGFFFPNNYALGSGE